MPKHKYELQGWEEDGTYKPIDSIAANSNTEAVNYFKTKYTDDESITDQYIIYNTGNTREVVE